MLEPAVSAHLRACLEDSEAAAFATGDVDDARRELSGQIDRMFRRFGLEGPAVASVVDHLVPVDGGEIVVRQYRPVPDPSSPDRASSPRPLPAHVYLHGGGWSTGSIDELVVDATARHRAATGCATFTVEYRLAPEHPFPEPLDDVVAALRWIRVNADELGIDPKALSLGGASAGANLAAAAVIAAPDLDVSALVLDVPALDLRPGVFARIAELGAAYHEEVGDAERAPFAGALDNYLTDPGDAASPLASPLLALDPTVFPETHLFTAELDMLRFGAEEFAARLRAAGVTVHLQCYEGALHGSAILTGTWPTARRWHDDTLATLRDIHERVASSS